MLDLQEEALDEVTLAIEGEIAGRLGRCCSRWNNRYGVLLLDGVAESHGVIAFVTENVASRKIGNQGFSLVDVACLARRQDKPQGIPQGVDDGMDLCGLSAARAPNRTSFRPPFLPAAC